MQLNNSSFSDLHVGLRAALTWQVTHAEIDAFAALSGDRNPLHADASYARALGFKDRVTHGFLLGSKVSALAGMLLPGQRCLLLEEQLAFPNPVFAGDTVEVAGVVAELWPDQNMLRVKIRASKPGETKPVTVGRGWVLCRVLS